MPAAADVPREDIGQERPEKRDEHQAPGAEEGHRHQPGNRQRREDESRATNPFPETVPLRHEWLEYEPVDGSV